MFRKCPNATVIKIVCFSPPDTFNNHHYDPSSFHNLFESVPYVHTAYDIRSTAPSSSKHVPSPDNGTLSPQAHPSYQNEIISDAEDTNQSENPSHAVCLKQRRSLQHVLSNTQRAQIVKWMINHASVHGTKGICAKALRNFPTLFRCSEKANLQRASRYWHRREHILALHKLQSKNNGHYFVRPTLNGLKKYAVKAAPGRGRTKSAWSVELSKALLADFDCF